MNAEALEIAVIASTILLGATWLSSKLKRRTIFEYQYGLLYKNGKYVKTLGPGLHWTFLPNHTINIIDNRRQTVTIAGQEIVSADNVGVKLSVLTTYRVADPVKASHQSQAWGTELYGLVQIVLRDVFSAMTVDEILKVRSTLGEKLLWMIKPQLEPIGVEMSMLQVKDVVLPAEIRKIYGDVLRAQKEGQAALERARGEQAALRSLANAARMLEGNPALMNLRVLQALNGQAGGPVPTVVLGVPHGLMPVGPPPPPPPPHHPPAHGPEHKPPGPKPPPPDMD